MSTCEYRDGGAPCTARAAWLVAVGTRKSDAQRSCGRHLNRTCELMIAAEERNATLTVSRAAWTRPAVPLEATTWAAGRQGG